MELNELNPLGMLVDANRAIKTFDTDHAGIPAFPKAADHCKEYF